MSAVNKDYRAAALQNRNSRKNDNKRQNIENKTDIFFNSSMMVIEP